MIITVTLNPAWDVTYRLPLLTIGEVHRVTEIYRRPGGKGVNVASVLHQLGRPVIATGLANPTFNDAVGSLGVRAQFIDAIPHIRSAVAVYDNDTTTSLWEPGVAPTHPEQAVHALLSTLDSLFTEISAVVISGSVAPGIDAALPSHIAQLARSRGAHAIIDTSGAALAAAATSTGAIIMPNSDELAELIGSPVTSVESAAAASRRLVEAGLGAVIATRGADGMIVTTASSDWQVSLPYAMSGNPTGAGDAAAAGIARALSNGDDLVTAACDAVALAATAVAAPIAGSVDPAMFAELRESVVPRQLPR